MSQRTDAPRPRGGSAGRPLPAKHHAALQAFVETFGVAGAARELGVGREAVARGLAGLGLREGTIALLGIRLKERAGQ
jgi:hypothetical protein